VLGDGSHRGGQRHGVKVGIVPDARVRSLRAFIDGHRGVIAAATVVAPGGDSAASAALRTRSSNGNEIHRAPDGLAGPCGAIVLEERQHISAGTATVEKPPVYVCWSTPFR